MKVIYKNKLTNLAATMAQSIGFNNTKKGKLESSNVQDAIDELSSITEGVGARSVTRISGEENWPIQTTGIAIPFDTPIETTDSNVFTSADGSGCLVKQKGIYSVRVRIHGLINANHEINCYIGRYKSDQDRCVYSKQVIQAQYASQFVIDQTYILRNATEGNDRFVVVIYSSGSGDFIYGTRDAGDTYLEVTKIANIE